MVIDTSLSSPLGADTADDIFISYHFAELRKTSVFETVSTPAESGFRRVYSVKLNNGLKYDRGSRRLVLFSANGVDLEKCYSIKIWVNFAGKDVIWSPARISVYKPKSRKIPFIGDIEDHFNLVCRFDFNQTLSMTSTVTQLSAFNTKSKISSFSTGQKRSFEERLIANFLADNLWFSIFIRRTLSNYNRQARITVAILTLCLAALANVMFYRETSGPQLQLGPIYFSPSLPFITLVTTLMSVVPSTLITFLFENTASRRLKDIPSTSYWKWSWLWRPMGYTFSILTILASVVFSIFYALSMEKNQVDKWIGAQLVSILLDIIFIPFVRIFIITAIRACFGLGERNKRCSIFINPVGDDVKRYESALHILSPAEIASKDTAITAKQHREQKMATYLSLYRIIQTISVTVAYCILSESIVPEDKYLADRNFRQRIRQDSLWTGPEMWNFIEKDIVGINFRTGDQYEQLSVRDEQYGNDRASYRIGPAKLVQMRRSCQSFTTGWEERDDEPIPEYQRLSPLHVPWLLSNDTAIPADWEPITVPKHWFEKCAFEAEIGTSVESSDIILSALRSANWIDNETSLLFFEQTFLNAALRTLYQLRVSFERTNGGGFHQQVKMNQIQLEMEKESNRVFYAAVVFLAVTISELVSLMRRVFKRKYGASTVLNFAYFTMNGVVIFLWVQRVIYLDSAMEAFHLDPRSIPPFEMVFLYQRHLQSAISVALFCRTLYLMKALSGLNSINATMRVMKRLLLKFSGWLMLMIPFTAAFTIVGMIFLNNSR